MQRISYDEVDRTYYNVTKDSVFVFEDIGEDKTYNGIINKFKDFRFEDQFINELREEFECQSYSHIIFGIYFKVNDNLFHFYLLLSAEMEIPSRTEIEYRTFPILSESEYDKTCINELLETNQYEKVYIKVKMNTKFYIQRGLDIVNQYEEEVEEIFDEGYDDDESPPAIVESPFISDNCSICLSAIPNILNIPCLHLSVCSQCEDIGKLLKCSVCRKKIERKVKI